MLQLKIEHPQSLLEKLYLSAVDEAELKPFLSELASVFDASLGTLATMDGLSRQDHLRITRCADHRDYAGSVPEHYAARSPFRPIMLLESNFGRIMTSSDMISPERRARDAFCNEFLRPTDHEFLITGVFARTSEQYNYIVLNRGRSFGEFDSDAVAGMQALVPHLSTMMRLRGSVVARERHIDFSHMLADRSGDGLVLLDRHGKVHSMNAKAATLLASGDGLRLKAAELEAAAPEESRQLKRVIGLLLASASPKTIQPGVSLTIQRPSGAQPYQLHIMPLSLRKFLYGGDDVELAIQIVGQNTVDDVIDTSLAASLGLSPAEIRVAAHLVAGMTPQRIAEAFGNSINTIRVHRRNLYRKLGINRQFDLIRALRGKL